jgi:hypothetical protein
MELTDYEQLSLNKLGDSIQNGKWSNEGLVQLIELCATYLNAKPIGQYAKENKISYNGAKKCRDVRVIAGVRMVIDNN